MATNTTIPRLLTEKQAGEALGLSWRSLEALRHRGGGPVHRRLGGRVYYTHADLTAWVEAGARRSASNTGRRTA